MLLLNEKFYKFAYKTHGVSAKGVHWNSKETQFKRFEVLSNLIKDEISTSSIIDVGCGYAHFLDYLEENSIKPHIYLGIDCEDFMIDICKKRFPKNIFLRCNILKEEIPKADYLICSGALNIMNSIEFLKAIKYCFEASNKAFIFNFLTQDSIHGLSKEDIYEHCKSLSTKVSIKENYLKNDCSIFLEK